MISSMLLIGVFLFEFITSIHEFHSVVKNRSRWQFIAILFMYQGVDFISQNHELK